jgi:hypothetical protein
MPNETTAVMTGGLMYVLPDHALPLEHLGGTME